MLHSENAYSRISRLTYRLALVKNVQQLALEAGNSPAIIFKHYRELTTEDQAREWFGIVAQQEIVIAQ